MDFSEDWKSLFPIGSVFDAPLLLSGPSSKAIMGPLCFNPKLETLTQLFNSPSLSPPLLNPPPRLFLSRFLSTSTTPDAPIPLSTASSIASLFGPQDQHETVSLLAHNRLQFLRCPHNNTVIVFFPTGCNHDQVGFLLLYVKEKSLVAVGDKKTRVFAAKKPLNQRIVKILVNPFVASSFFESNSYSSNTIGYVLVYTTSSVHWFLVKISKTSEMPVLGYMGCKIFKSCPIVGACWSPHLPEESLVLLENGTLFLFDLESHHSNVNFKGTRLKVSWGESSETENCKWLGCEFSWHPRTLIVARSDAVFLVDWRYDEFNVTCVAKIGMFGVYAPVGKEHFLGLSRTVSDQFHFVLTSDSMLVICDVRKPLIPVLQWAHGLDKPYCIDVFRLSELRSNCRHNTHAWATLSGYGIILGSFWNCEFSLFCYGPVPAQEGSIALEISKISKSFYGWELPSDLSLSGNKCQCGSCLVRYEFLKDALPEWIDWQQKKEIVLGFGILSNDLSSLLFEPDQYGGFTLIRLMSSGKLESQRYCANWDLVKKIQVAHGDPLLCSEGNLLYSMDDEKYKFPRKFMYVKFDYLCAYLNGNLSQLLDSDMTKPCMGLQGQESFSLDSHEILCEKLKTCGFSRFRASPAVTVVFNDINFPTSIHEIALRRTWAGLPMELLQLAFSGFSVFLDPLSDQKKVALEFLVVPDLPQLPPFFSRKPSNRSNRWSSKVQRSDALVGPVLPLPVLITLHEFRNGCLNSQEEIGGFSPDVEFRIRCNEVMQVARQIAVSDSISHLHDDTSVSLADDRDDIWVESGKPKSFLLYHPVAGQCYPKSHSADSCVCKDGSFASLISKVQEKKPDHGDKVETVGQEIFDDLCPIGLKFEAGAKDFSSEEVRIHNLFKRYFLKWQEQFSPYQKFCTQFICQKSDA